MDVKEVLRFTDGLVFAKTGKYLDDLQKTVLQGVWEGRTYLQIAEESDYSEGYTRDVASKLLKVLSELLKENVNKYNFRSAMERYHDCNISNFKDVVNFGNINNFCTETPHPPKPPQNSPPTQTSTENNTQQKLDLRDTPHHHRKCDHTPKLPPPHHHRHERHRQKRDRTSPHPQTSNSI
jgi:hypothetical protein